MRGFEGTKVVRLMVINCSTGAGHDWFLLRCGRDVGIAGSAMLGIFNDLVRERVHCERPWKIPSGKPQRKLVTNE